MSNLITAGAASDHIVSLLQTLGKGTIGTSLFVNKEPDGAGVLDNVVTVYDSPAHRAPELNYTWEYPSVQVRVRRKPGDWQAGKLFVLELMEALHCYVGTISSIKYHLVRVINGPIPLGEDERGRPRWTFNCEINRST